MAAAKYPLAPTITRSGVKFDRTMRSLISLFCAPAEDGMDVEMSDIEYIVRHFQEIEMTARLLLHLGLAKEDRTCAFGVKLTKLCSEAQNAKYEVQYENSVLLRLVCDA